MPDFITFVLDFAKNWFLTCWEIYLETSDQDLWWFWISFTIVCLFISFWSGIYYAFYIQVLVLLFDFIGFVPLGKTVLYISLISITFCLIYEFIYLDRKTNRLRTYLAVKKGKLNQKKHWAVIVRVPEVKHKDESQEKLGRSIVYKNYTLLLFEALGRVFRNLKPLDRDLKNRRSSKTMERFLKAYYCYGIGHTSNSRVNLLQEYHKKNEDLSRLCPISHRVSFVAATHRRYDFRKVLVHRRDTHLIASDRFELGLFVHGDGIWSHRHKFTVRGPHSR